MAKEAELVLDTKAALGEGAVWYNEGQVLYWVDIVGCTVFTYDPTTGKNSAVDTGQPVGTVVPRSAGQVMVALRDGFASLDLNSGAIQMIADPESDSPANRFNDGKCDPAGRFWAGTMPSGDTGDPDGGLYCLYPDMHMERKEGGIACSNGIAWSLDKKTMYYIDTPTMKVVAYDYDDSTGEISNKRTAIEVPDSEGLPDGSTIDADGKLWVAHWDGRQVVRWDPDTGEKMESISLPAQKVTSCAFGGPDLDLLYITTARVGLDDDALAGQPLAGGLFVAEPGVNGIKAPVFAG